MAWRIPNSTQQVSKLECTRAKKKRLHQSRIREITDQWQQADEDHQMQQREAEARHNQERHGPQTVATLHHQYAGYIEDQGREQRPSSGVDQRVLKGRLPGHARIVGPRKIVLAGGK